MNPKGNISSLKPRQKGSKNKFTTLKASFLEAFEGMGGTKGLQEWATKDRNRGQFYQMVAKMLPANIEGKVDHSGGLTIRVIKEVRSASK